jgi:hypothetical protein
MTSPGFEPGRCSGNPATNRLARLSKQATLSSDFTREIWLNTEDVNTFNAFLLQLRPLNAAKRLIVTQVNIHILMLRIIYDEDFLTRVFCADGVSFHISGHVNCHNCRLCGAEQPPEVSVRA